MITVSHPYVLRPLTASPRSSSMIPMRRTCPSHRTPASPRSWNVRKDALLTWGAQQGRLP